jgi:hypothetical protein
MECPLFVDFTRECIKEVASLPADTLEFCTTERYVDCPFYRSIKKVGFFCECITGCPTYESFKASDFKEFVMMSKRYCLSENNLHCHRYILKKQGKTVPRELRPDGSIHKG